ncbi:DNA-(apurinic or apyrimidinic site) endonuclease [Carcharodon carcharias]|uniref:DNA-(apurinic or apyrimidinic site) endonuclease n=1 Tax=Carcharodon carcharias TaxID=13397 RepID=UPI001B7EF3E5|nr:DNA-(apurinic or apyrimidinic site) endonuclease [Carcharodon carcharias]
MGFRSRGLQRSAGDSLPALWCHFWGRCPDQPPEHAHVWPRPCRPSRGDPVCQPHELPAWSSAPRPRLQLGAPRPGRRYPGPSSELRLPGPAPARSSVSRPLLARSLLLTRCLWKMPRRARKEVAAEKEEQEAEPVPKKAKRGGGKAADGAVKDGEAVSSAFEDTPDKLLTENGKKSDLKITSWNVDGLRAWVKKKSLEWVSTETPDILCLQETKCAEKQLPGEVKDMPDYPYQYWSSSQDKEGYSGVGMLCKIKPLNVTFGIGVAEHDNEGRVITAEFNKYFLVTTYVPNSGRGLVRLDYRKTWDVDFLAYLKGLEGKKPVILCGDLNVAHQEIDLKNPKTNKKTAGFTAEERQGFGNLLSEGFVDTYRHLYPDTCHAYTFWTYLGNCRAKNVGWRLDYFVLSKALLPHLCDSKIRSKAMGSDHCPITLLMAM